MLSWLNPFKWWHLYRHRQRWQHINVQLVDAYHQQDYILTAASAEFLVEIALNSGNKQLLLKSYTLNGHNLSFVKMLKAECEQGIKLFFMLQMSII